MEMNIYYYELNGFMCTYVNIIYTCLYLYLYSLSSISLRSYKSVSEKIKNSKVKMAFCMYLFMNLVNQKHTRRVDGSMQKRIINSSWRDQRSWHNGDNF